MDIEIWKDIKGYEGFYQVSTLGRVKSLSRKIWNGSGWKTSKEFIMSAPIDSVGYPVVALQAKPRKRYVRVHRLVAETFIPNPENYRVVNHLDLDKTNNNVTNLEWCTHKHNIEDARNKGAFKNMIMVKIIETGQIFKSQSECARAIGGDRRHIGDCLNGKLKTHKGYHFERVET